MLFFLKNLFICFLCELFICVTLIVILLFLAFLAVTKELLLESERFNEDESR